MSLALSRGTPRYVSSAQVQHLSDEVLPNPGSHAPRPSVKSGAAVDHLDACLATAVDRWGSERNRRSRTFGTQEAGRRGVSRGAPRGECSVHTFLLQ